MNLNEPIKPKVDPPHKQDVHQMNLVLEHLGGKFVDGRPFWRIVWADNQFEFRQGVFDTYGENDIWLERKYHAALRVPKYQHVEMRGKWILEKLHFDNNPEVVNEGDYRYNCLLIFQDANKEYIRPRVDICQMAIWAWRNHVRRDNKSDADRQDEWMTKEVAKNRDHIENRPEPATINWKPIDSKTIDLGKESLK